METFWLCFVPLFVAVDAIGVLPLYVALTEGMDAARRRRVILQSVGTAATVALVFLWIGPSLLAYLGLEVFDFMIAGGLLLFAIALTDLLSGEKRQRQADPESLGAVPIGVPLITGPAVLTSCVLLAGLHGKAATAAALLANMALAGALFRFSGPIERVLGRTGSKILSKIASLLLASIAVMLVRRGVEGLAGR